MSETSTTKSEASDVLRAFATLRVTGDKLLPDEITKILQVPPVHAAAKGEKRSVSPRTPPVVSKTGVWYFSTDRISASNNLNDHLAIVFSILTASRGGALPVVSLRNMMKRKGLKSSLTLFWHGKSGAKKPVVAETIQKLFDAIPVAIETDFDVERDEARPNAA